MMIDSSRRIKMYTMLRNNGKINRVLATIKEFATTQIKTKIIVYIVYHNLKSTEN